MTSTTEQLAAQLQISEHAIAALTNRLSALTVECMDEHGKPKAPSKKVLMRARAALPSQYSGSFDHV